MRDRALVVTAAAFVLAAALVGWALLTASPALRAGFDLTTYFLASLIVFVDALDLGLRLYFRRLHTGAATLTSVPLETGGLDPRERRRRLRPYALLASVHNAEPELDDFVEAMEPYRDRLWLIDDASTDRTALRLRQAGFRCLAGGVNRRKPGAIRQLLKTLPPEIETVLVMDPDIRITTSGGELSDLETVISDFQASGMAAACPRIQVSDDGWLARLQGLEYGMAFGLGRMSLGDKSITSGIALYRRRTLERILERHSLSVYAEDLENTFMLLDEGERIYYDGRLVIETQAQCTWRGWFSQRVGWSYGLLKVYAERFGELRRGSKGRFVTVYHYLVYMGVLTLLLHPFKILSLGLLGLSLANAADGFFGLGWIPDTSLSFSGYFLAAHLKYSALTLAGLMLSVQRGERLRLAPVVPIYFLYSLLHLIPVTVGFANWLSLRVRGRRLYRDHYQEEAAFAVEHRALVPSSPRQEPHHERL